MMQNVCYIGCRVSVQDLFNLAQNPVPKARNQELIKLSVLCADF